MAANARTATKKAAARKTAKPVPVPEGDFEPVRITSKSDKPEERIVLFYVDDTAYDIPKKISRGHGLRYLRTARVQGEAIAAQELLEVLIGEAGYEALMGCEDLTDEDLDAIMSRLRDGALGAVEDEPEGKGRRR